MAEFRAGLQARQQARIAAMVRDAFHTLRGARTRGTWEDFQALVRKRAHVQQLLDLETLRTHPRTPVLDEAEYTKRTLAALQEREACARARLPERLVPVEAQRQAVQEAKARRRATHGILGRAVLPSALPARAEAQVQQVLVQRGVIASMTGAQVEAHDIAKLRPGQCLNDEVINFYGQLIQQRANQAAPQPGDASPCWAVHVFSSFFWQNLTTRGYAGVRRWSRRVDLFTKDVVLMPINLGQAHWVCAAIDLRLRRFAYYDSMGMPSPAVLQRLRAYLADELKDKHGLALYLDDWEDYCAGDTSPQQSNGYDCGVFAAQTLEQLSRRDPGVPYPPLLGQGRSRSVPIPRHSRCCARSMRGSMPGISASAICRTCGGAWPMRSPRSSCSRDIGYPSRPTLRAPSRNTPCTSRHAAPVRPARVGEYKTAHSGTGN